MSRTLAIVLLIPCLHVFADPTTLADPPSVIADFEDYLVIEPVGRGGRSPVHTDAIEATIVDGSWRTPEPGDAVRVGRVPRIWQSASAGEDGWLTDDALRGGYAVATIERDAAGPAILEARGHSMVYVNGAPRPGDPYANGSLRLPVMLEAGENEFLFKVGRGRVKARLVDVPRTDDGDPKTFFFNNADDTVPNAVVGVPLDAYAGVVIANIGTDWMPNRSLLATGPGGETVTSAMPAIAPGSIRKVPVRLEARSVDAPGVMTFRIEIVDPGSVEPVDVRSLDVKVVEPTAARRVTFRSELDDSVQFYGLVPSTAVPREGDPSGAPGLILTLHGAGVDARRQAAAYAPKDFAHVVAPTNRRKFGFDWEDWGRLDAMEVLEHARRTLGTDPDRQWVTGHSMGGHGTWQAAAHFPDRFAAAAPSAGWIAFHTYGADRIEGNDEPHSIESIMARAANPSDTLLLRDNLDELGIYVLHGDADDNVPVDQARAMRRSLAESHPDFAYHEEPGVGHWWGNRCVDWPPLIRFLEERSLDPDPDQVRFTTVSPGINPGGGWFRITQQQLANAPSRVEGTRNDAESRIELITENVARLELDLDDRMPAWTVVIDGDEVGPDAKLDLLNGRGAPAFYDRTSDGWRRRAIINPRAKRPERNGSFKDVFRHQPILVVGTMGDETENRITLAKAIHDAESFLYRGNGVLDVILDVDFDREQHPRRNVILYGNQETNAAWPQLLAKDPLQVDRTGIRFEGLEVEGDDLAVLAIRPRPDWTTVSVGVVAGTGPSGMRLAERIPLFRSGVHHPDLVVFGPESIDPDTEGLDGIRAAAFFENDWSLGEDHAVREASKVK